MKSMRYSALFLAAALLLTGCGNTQYSGISQQESSPAQVTEPEQTEQPNAGDTDTAGSAGESIAEMLGVEDYKAPWKREDYPALEITDIPAKGKGTARMTLMPYALDDVCVSLLAEDAYSDGGKIYCANMKLGLYVSGVEQDIIEVPQTLAAPDGTFEFAPENWQEQVGYTSMPDVYFGINGFSGESAVGCEYYTTRWNEETGLYNLEHLGSTDERCRLTPETQYTLPPEQLSGEYGFANCPAVVSCDGALPQEEALNTLAGKYLDYFTGDDPDRSFKALEFRNVKVEILGDTMSMPADESGYPAAPWNSLETWEMSQNTWLVSVSAEFRGEGTADCAIGQLSPEEWYELPNGEAPPRYYLMYSDGDSWYLWSRSAYRCIPAVLN